MRFGVLGTVEVWTEDGTPVRVPELKVRTLLASLLAEPGRIVPAHRLIEDLWGEDLPARPTGALQTKVSQLRRALEDAEAGARALVESRTPGYRLAVAPEALDVHRFTELTARAKAGGARERVALLGEALEVWRGPAFADFDGHDAVRAAAGRLEEQRLAAVEERAAARLELGEHRELAGELAELAHRHPLRERLREVQLTALYRSGRQGEALAAYAALRGQLADELGVDPGPALTRLHQAMLRQEPWPAAAPEGADEPRTNLPTELTGLVGRGAAVERVRALLAEGRLVTLTGPGGVGKTRLAVESAQRAVADFPDGVWLVELASLRRASDPGGKCSQEEVAEAMLGALGIQEGAAPGPVAERLTRAVRGKRLLWVLDNCEHVVAAVAEVARTLLRAAPHLRILATSQEPLGLAGEAVWHVPPLEQADAVRLFLARAAAAAPGLAVEDGDGAVVAEICRRLDGLPLALELAATRVRALGVRELGARLDDRFRLLAAGFRGAPLRQQTLRAMIDWSWELLTEPEQRVLRRLAVHADGCSLPAAEEVCAGEGVRPADVLDLLARLVDRSLVVVVPTAHGPRYRLLESVAAYCVERLGEAGELDGVRERHLRYYSALAERAAPLLYGREQRTWLERLDAEAANVRAALDRAVRAGAAEPALRLVDALAWYWFLRGRLAEADRRLAAALAVPGEVPRALRLRCLTWQVGMASLAGEDTDPVARAADVLEQYEAVADPAGQAWAHWFLGFAQIGLGDPAAEARRVDRALEGFRSVGDRWGEAAALSSRSMRSGDPAGRRRDAEDSARIFAELGDGWGQLQVSGTLASFAVVAGDLARAAELHEGGLRIAQDLGLGIQVSYELSGLGRIALLRGDFAAARELHERAQRVAAQQSHLRGEMYAETGLAIGARREGRLADAEAHCLRWLEWCRGRDGDIGAALLLAELGYGAELRGDAARARQLHLDSYAAAGVSGDPPSVAFALEGLAGALALSGQPVLAARLLGCAATVRAGAGTPQAAGERVDGERITAAVRGGLGEAAFAEAFGQGAARSARELVAVVREWGACAEEMGGQGESAS